MSRILWSACGFHCSKKADDYVFAIGKDHSLRQFVERSFKAVGILLTWEGSSVDEVAKRADTGEIVVLVDPEEYHRPSHDTHGDPGHAIAALGWKQEKTFEDIVDEMTRAAWERCHSNS